MDILQLSKEMLIEALTTGNLTLQSGDTRALSTSQLIAIARFVISNQLTNQVSPAISPSSSLSTSNTALTNIPIEYFNPLPETTSIKEEIPEVQDLSDLFSNLRTKYNVNDLDSTIENQKGE